MIVYEIVAAIVYTGPDHRHAGMRGAVPMGDLLPASPAGPILRAASLQRQDRPSTAYLQSGDAAGVDLVHRTSNEQKRLPEAVWLPAVTPASQMARTDPSSGPANHRTKP